MKFVIFLAVIFMSFSVADGQIAPKSTPAADKLVEAAKDEDKQKQISTEILNQARSSLDITQKQLTKALTDKQQELQAKLNVDPKYKKDTDEIAMLQKQLQQLQEKATTDYQAKSSPVQLQLQQDAITVKVLDPIVRKENDWADTVTFDPTTKTWKDSAAKK